MNINQNLNYNLAFMTLGFLKIIASTYFLETNQILNIAHFGFGVGYLSVELATHVGNISVLQDESLTNCAKLSDNIKMHGIKNTGTILLMALHNVQFISLNIAQTNIFLYDNNSIAKLEDIDFLKLMKY